LTTVGQALDTSKARAHMDIYFSRMMELTNNKNINSRMKFMLLVSCYVHYSCAYTLN
jgi:translation initiation factor 4G